MQSLQSEQAKERMKYYSLKEQLEAAKQTIAQQKSEIEKLRSNSTEETPPRYAILYFLEVLNATASTIQLSSIENLQVPFSSLL